jgi:DNA-binding IclR family transcriptional regulator
VAILKCFTDAQQLSRGCRAGDAAQQGRLPHLWPRWRKGADRAAGGDAYGLDRAIALGGRALRATTLHSASHAELAALAQATGETATVEMLVEAEMFHANGDQPQLLGPYRRSARAGPCTPSTGKAVLAHLSGQLEPLLQPPTRTEHADRGGAAARLASAAAGLQRSATSWRSAMPPSPRRSSTHGQAVAAICVGGPTVACRRSAW